MMPAGSTPPPRTPKTQVNVRAALPVLAAALVLVALAAAVCLWWELRPLLGRDGPVSAAGPSPKTVVIPPGESARQIGQRLEQAGVVRSARAFVLAARITGVAGSLRHGEYSLSPTQGALEIAGVLARGESVLHRVTIPEGYTVAQIAELLAGMGLAGRERLTELATAGAHRFPRATLRNLPIDSLEGYLFPDTYYLAKGLGEAAVIEHLLNRFDAAVGAALRDAAAARGLTLHQLITIASLIEREARVASERPIIAGVIFNRLERGMKLEIDASVLYALGSHKPIVTYADLEVDSPYNTYRYPGLPPGPIANPGLAAIAAAAAPAQTPYLYYVLKPDGTHQFSRTLEEHNRAVRRYRP